MAMWVARMMMVSLLFTQAWAAQPVLQSSTESLPAKATRPSPALINLLTASMDADDKAGLDQCLVEKGLKPDAYSRLFLASKLSGPSQDSALYFVRPALQPYCLTFYGAHLFRYWLVLLPTQPATGAGRVVHAGIADAMVVLPSRTQGLNDIIETNCNAVQCGSVLMRFDSGQYRPARCREYRIAKGEPKGLPDQACRPEN